jgi:RNA polymerase sigma factor (sigma-70 family)
VAGETLGDVIRRLGRAGWLQNDLAQTDAQLVERFARRSDEPAFAALMARHGPMVLGVCRRLLHDAQEAEDAFQATFLVLARKASRIQRQALLGPWLYGVAWRVAVRLRGRLARRRGREQSGVDLDGLPADDAAWSEVHWLVHEEVQRLPKAYRSTVVLCCLEGKSNEEAARLLGRPVGTIKSRLLRARELLRSRLARRGLAVSGAVMGTELAVPAAPASAALAETTLRAARSLAAGGAASGLVTARVVMLSQEVLRTMWWKKFVLAAALMLAVALLGGVGSRVYQAWAARPDEALKHPAQPADLPAPADRPKEEKAKGDALAIQGVWRVTAIETEGRGVQAGMEVRQGHTWRVTPTVAQEKEEARQVKWGKWVIGTDKIVVEADEPGQGVQKTAYVYKLDPTRTPKTFDLTPEVGPELGEPPTIRAIYGLDGDVLKICRRLMPAEIQYLRQLEGRRPERSGLGDLLALRPSALATKEGSKTSLITFRREE